MRLSIVPSWSGDFPLDFVIVKPTWSNTFKTNALPMIDLDALWAASDAAHQVHRIHDVIASESLIHRYHQAPPD